MTRPVRIYVGGEASGQALVLTRPLSFYGGVDPSTGRIIDQSQDRCGEPLAGRILVMPGARGSSSSSSVLAEVLRAGIGPAGIVLGRVDPILPVAGIVAHALYGRICPIVVGSIAGIEHGRRIAIVAPDERDLRSTDDSWTSGTLHCDSPWPQVG